MRKFADKNKNFSNALKRLNEANTIYKFNKKNDICQDALIKRFEFTFELAWKTLREFLSEQGYAEEISSPKGILALADQEGYLGSEEAWLSMLEDRNLTSHDYSRELSAIAERISSQYCKEFAKLSKLFSS